MGHSAAILDSGDACLCSLQSHKCFLRLQIVKFCECDDKNNTVEVGRGK